MANSIIRHFLSEDDEKKHSLNVLLSKSFSISNFEANTVYGLADGN